jgi:hypothetical protein
MKIWRLRDPGDNFFAHASRRGTWSSGYGLCTECDASTQQRIKPLIIEWEPGSDRIGDFTCVGFNSDAVVTDRAVKVLIKLGGFEPGPVEMYQNPKLKRHPRSRNEKPRIWLPYRGPSLFDLWITRNVNLDLEKSSVKLVKACSTCGHQRYEVSGIESWETRWNKEQRETTNIHIPRELDRGIYIRETVLEGNGFFRVREVPSWIFCTDPVKILIQEEKLTHIEFLKMGDTF